MRKQSFYIFLLFTLFLGACYHSTNELSKDDYTNYDTGLNLLGVDYSGDSKKSIKQVIEFSNIRKSGYGVLINIESSYSKAELDAIKLKLQKEDINAIHSFDVNQNDSIMKNVFVAMEGAQFVWFLSEEIGAADESQIKQLIIHIDKKNSLIVVNKNQLELLKNILQNN